MSESCTVHFVSYHAFSYPRLCLPKMSVGWISSRCIGFCNSLHTWAAVAPSLLMLLLLDMNMYLSQIFESLVCCQSSAWTVTAQWSRWYLHIYEVCMNGNDHGEEICYHLVAAQVCWIIFLLAQSKFCSRHSGYCPKVRHCTFCFFFNKIPLSFKSGYFR